MKKFFSIIMICLSTAIAGSADVVSLSIKNTTNNVINQIRIVPSKAGVEQPDRIIACTDALELNETKSFDLDSNYHYEIQAFDTEGRFCKKSHIRLKYSWQKIAFTDMDFGKSWSKTENPSSTCALIIWNRTSRTIDHIDIEQDGEKQQYRVSIKNGQQKTIDILRNTETYISLYSSKLEYAKSKLIYDSSHDFLVFSKDDCTEMTLLGLFSDILTTICSKIKELFNWQNT